MKKIFRGDGEDFSAYHQAEHWARAKGYSIAPMCNPLPTGIKKGVFRIAKWKNLNAEDILKLDGRFESKDFRTGPVIVITRDEDEN